MPLPTLDEVKERKLVQWGLAYLAGVWLALQVVAVLGATYDWPNGLLRAVPVVLAVGFLIALVVAWYHGERGAQRVSGTELAVLVVLLAIAGLGVMVVGRGSNTEEEAIAAREGGVESQELREQLGLPEQRPGFEVSFISEGNPPELGKPITEIDAPVINNVVSVDVSVLNTSHLTAKTVVVIAALCETCQYVEEGSEWHSDPLKPRSLSKAFLRLPPRSRADLPVLRIMPPPQPSPGFYIKIGVSCDECIGLSEHTLKVRTSR